MSLSLSRRRKSASETAAAAAAAAPPTAGKQFRFDEVLVAPRNAGYKRLDPPVLSYDRGAAYAGPRGNWRLPFRGCSLVRRERDGGGGRAGRAAPPSGTLVLTLAGGRLRLRCTARGGRTAADARALESFVEGMERAHGRARARNRGGDPRALDDGGAPGAGAGAPGGGGRRPSGGKGRQQRRRGRVAQVTPASAGVLLSPARKRNAGSFHSPERRRAGGGGGDGYRHYDPRLSSTPVGAAPNPGSGDGSVGNVVREPPSAAVRRLRLPPKSPRNATPLRVRRSSPGEGGGARGEGRARSISSQLAGISGGNIELRRRVDAKAGGAAEADEGCRRLVDFGEDGRDGKRNGEREEADGRRKGDEGGHSSEEGGGSGGAPKRRRLQKPGGKTDDDDNDSDEEFDESVDNATSCKKKLRMSFEDGDDGDEGKDGGAAASLEELAPVGMKSDAKSDAKSESPPPSNAASPTLEEMEEEAGLSRSSSATAALTEDSSVARSRSPSLSNGSEKEEDVGSSEKDPKSKTVAETEPSYSKQDSSVSPTPSIDAVATTTLPGSIEKTEPSKSTETEPPKSQSTADAALAPSPSKKAPPKKGTITHFFSRRGLRLPADAAAAKANSAKRSSAPATHGVAPSTPSKRVRPDSGMPRTSNATALPATPPRSRTDGSKPTPVPACGACGDGNKPDGKATGQPCHSLTRQRKITSRYFDDLGNGNAIGAADFGGGTPNASWEEEDDLPDYQTGYQDEGYHDENDDVARYQDENEDIAPRKPMYQHRRTEETTRSYGITKGRMLGHSRLAPQRLGAPRLGESGIRSHRPPVVAGSHRKTPRQSPVSRLDFDGRCKPVSASKLDFGMSTADLAHGSGARDGPPPLAPLHDGRASPPTAPFPSIAGIQNLGNTCYLSASLQALFSLPRFVSDLYATYETQSPAKEMPLTRSLLEVAAAIGALKEEDAPSISAEAARGKGLSKQSGNPAALKRRMDVLTNKFAGYKQMDAHEFLSDLVDFLHDELRAPTTGGEGGEENKSTGTDENANPNQVAAKSKVGEGKNNGKKAAAAAAQREPGMLPTDEYFCLNVRVSLKCDSCGYSRSKDEMYRHLSLDVMGDSAQDLCTVERSLQRFFQPERREIKCEKCESGKTATQTMEIISCPKALLLHFKRFIVTQEMKAAVGDKSDGKGDNTTPPSIMEMVLRKNKVIIPVEESLSIKDFVSKDEACPPGKYHLRGVVHHVGSTADSGHYTTCAKRTLLNQQGDDGKKSDNDASGTPGDNKEQWVFFDDRVGAKKTLGYVTGQELNQRNCYMVLYELKS